MNSKKQIILAITALGFFSVGLTMNTKSVQASTWHKGIPAFMKGHFYRTKLQPKYVKNSNGKRVPFPGRRFEGIHVGHKSTINFTGYQYSLRLKKCRYSYKGKYIIIKGKYDKALTSYPAFKLRKISNKHIYGNAGSYVKNNGSTTHYFSKLEKMTRIH